MIAVNVPSDAALRRLASARLVSVAGSVSAGVALAAVLYARTGSAVWVGAALLIALATPVVISPWAGALTDRVDRRRLLIASELCGAACFAAMALVSDPAALLALAVPAAIAAAPFLPASGALVPSVVDASRLNWANSRLALARTAGQLVGPLVGGGVVAGLNGSAAFAMNSASFLASAALIATVRGPIRACAPPVPVSRNRGAMEGLALLVRVPLLRALTLGFILVDIGNGLVLPAEVPLAHAFGTGSLGYGALVVVWGIGGVAGAPVARAALDRWGEAVVISASAACLGAGFALTAVAPWFALALGGLAIGGGSMSIAAVGEDVLLQRRVADDVRGRVYAAHVAAVQASLALPLVFAGFVVNTLGAQTVYGIAAVVCGLGVIALTALLRSERRVRV
jgi:MFS family permease